MSPSLPSLALALGLRLWNDGIMETPPGLFPPADRKHYRRLNDFSWMLNVPSSASSFYMLLAHFEVYLLGIGLYQ